MSIMDLRRAAAEHGYQLVPTEVAEMYDDMAEAVLEAEALRCDLDLLTRTLVDDFTAGLASR